MGVLKKAEAEGFISESMRKTARSMRYKGFSLWEIADHIGIGTTTVQRICEDIPVDNRAKPRMKPPEWLDEARARLATGKNRRTVALELGIPIASFYRAYRRFEDLAPAKAAK